MMLSCISVQAENGKDKNACRVPLAVGVLLVRDSDNHVFMLKRNYRD